MRTFIHGTLVIALNKVVFLGAICTSLLTPAVLLLITNLIALTVTVSTIDKWPSFDIRKYVQPRAR